MTNEQVYAMSFGKLYPLLAGKALRKGRTQAEVDQVIGWMTGYTPAQIQQAAEKGVSYQQFFAQAPALNPRPDTGHRQDLRCTDRDHPRAADAGHPPPGQAHR